MADTTRTKAAALALIPVGGTRPVCTVQDLRDITHSLYDAAATAVTGPQGPQGDSVVGPQGPQGATATESAGWIDITGPINPPTTGPTIPVFTAWSAPHAAFKSALFQIGDIWHFDGHIPHGIDPAAGLYLHAHVIVDGSQTNDLKFTFDYTYAHGYSRQVFSGPLQVPAQQAATGVAKTHQIIEIAAPILAGVIETDGIVKVVATRVTNGGSSDVTNNVFGLMFDVHAKLLKHTSTNRNYPFE